ncbi:CdaR family transcriptional regulator [Halobacillus sp. Nhm2S1]|uniref:PucR family transcriptional regulator n=1 Tax=Halobacillus sp. Nhm2S1 TaxID=2866716 RepID=UPI001C72AD99|nr:helix-turn-helix domain-containing protein [Halobacillus sp. Nhm2S1]MBX0357217.1 helix-turn-helix domain-containing protein [Halobacillus sp. Nhm2S1]
MSVVDQLKRLYPSITINKLGFDNHTEYKWFQTENDEIVGIKKDELDHPSSELLSIFLKPLSSEESTMTEREKQWSSFLYKKEETQEMVWPVSFRFVLFSIEDVEAEKAIVKEALQSLFPQEMPLLWTSDREGIIIEEMSSKDQEIMEFEGMADVLSSDFYTDIHFFISEFTSSPEDASKILKWAQHGAGIAKEHKLGSMITYKDIVPYLYIDALPEEEWEHIRRSIFKDIEKDKELLQTIRIFLESGSNTSLAAKKLYMHRNSLQYRVDKFIEKTGLDIKQFEGAVITYLALLHMEY